jgi:hypothetical protein
VIFAKNGKIVAGDRNSDLIPLEIFAISMSCLRIPIKEMEDNLFRTLYNTLRRSHIKSKELERSINLPYLKRRAADFGDFPRGIKFSSS